MADREVAGRCTCPICGLPNQDVRVNVNSKLYVYCDNGCSFKFNSLQSRKFLPELRAGRNVATSQGITIFSMVGKENNKNAENQTIRENITRGNSTGNITGSNAGRSNAGNDSAGGRVDTGRRTADSTGSISGGSTAKRGFFAGWLDDDDD